METMLRKGVVEVEFNDSGASMAAAYGPVTSVPRVEIVEVKAENIAEAIQKAQDKIKESPMVGGVHGKFIRWESIGTANELLAYAKRHSFFGSNSQTLIIEISALERFFK